MHRDIFIVLNRPISLCDSAFMESPSSSIHRVSCSPAHHRRRQFPFAQTGGGNGGKRLTATDLGGGGERGKDCLDNRSFCLVNTERVGIWRGVFYDGNDRGKHRGHV